MLLPIYPVLKKGIIAFFLLIFLFVYGFSQEKSSRVISLDEAIGLALQNNPEAKNAELSLQSSQTSGKYSISIPATNFQYYGLLNSSGGDYFFEVKQSFSFPLVYSKQNEIAKSRVKISENEQQIIIGNISAQVKLRWQEWLLAYRILLLEAEQDTIFENLLNCVQNHSVLCKDSVLTMALAEDRYAKAQNDLYQSQENVSIFENRLKQLVFIDEPIIPDNYEIDLYAIDSDPNRKDKFAPAKQMNYFQELTNLKNNEEKLAKLKYIPEFTAGYYAEQFNGYKGFSGFMAGISVPLWFTPQRWKIKDAQIQTNIARNNQEKQQFVLNKEIENHQILLDKLFVEISYNRENALKLADLLEKNAREKIKTGLMDVSSFIEILNKVYSVRKGYLEMLVNYNKQAIELEYLIR
jgi:heavy metal efflux system protein